MTSTLDMNSALSSNLKALAERYPSLAERLCSVNLNQVQTTKAQDGGICYVKKGADNKWHALSNSNDPIKKAQTAVTELEDRIGNGIAPAVVIGLNPGYTLEILYKHFKDNYYDKYIPRRIYVIIDSLECLYGWLRDKDRSDILNQPEVEFYWHQEVKRIVRQCKRDEQRSHLFIPVSTLPERVSMKLIEPLAEFFISRQEEEEKLYEENCEYYKSQSDKELDKILVGEANRKPRLLIPSHASSTVVQYSVRDTAAMFEKEGWEVRIIHMKTDLSRWRINKNINEFKPDIYLLVNHLRTEDTTFYPPEMMFITWVQDTVSYINNSENAKAWNKHVKSKKKRRDLIIGYVGQVKEYGYLEERLSECPMIVNQDIFKERELTTEEKAKYECDICFASNRSKETSLIVKDDLAPKLEEYGFTEYILMSVHDHLWEYYRDEKTCVGYVQLEDKIIEIPEVCSLVEKLINKDDHDFIIQRIYWELNDVIYRHVVLEWIDEMGDKKLHLYGRGWEDHPRFSKYAKGILQHGEELSLAYQCAKHCLHLNSLEGEHQRLTEIIDAKGQPLTRLSLDEEVMKRQKLILEGSTNLKKTNIHFLNSLWNISKTTLEKFPKSKFHEKVNETFNKQIENINVKLDQESISFSNKEFLTLKSSSQDQEEKLRKDEAEIYNNLLASFINKKKKTNKDLIPLEVSSFIFKLFEGKRRISLPQYPAIETNLFCKIIQLTSKEDVVKTLKSVRKNIHFGHLISEFIPSFINWKFSLGEEKEVEPLIQKAYKRSPDMCDLNFRFALKNHKIDKKWYQKARKDLIKGRLSIQAAGQLATLSVKSSNEIEVIKDISCRLQNINNFKNVKIINILPIVSQALKLLDATTLQKIKFHLNENYPEDKISAAFDIADFENGLSNQISIKKLLNQPNGVLEVRQLAANSISRKTMKFASICYMHLFEKKTKLLFNEIRHLIKNFDFKKNPDAEYFINDIYKQNNNIYDLNTLYGQRVHGNLLNFLEKDILQNRASIHIFYDFFKKMNSDSLLNGDTIKLIHSSLSKQEIAIKHLHKLTFIFSSIINNENFEKSYDLFLNKNSDYHIKAAFKISLYGKKELYSKIPQTNLSAIFEALLSGKKFKNVKYLSDNTSFFKSIAKDLICSNEPEKAYKIFYGLIFNGIPLELHEVRFIINLYPLYNKSMIFKFINLLYKHQHGLKDLYFLFFVKILDADLSFSPKAVIQELQNYSISEDTLGRLSDILLNSVSSSKLKSLIISKVTNSKKFKFEKVENLISLCHLFISQRKIGEFNKLNALNTNLTVAKSIALLESGHRDAKLFDFENPEIENFTQSYLNLLTNKNCSKKYDPIETLRISDLTIRLYYRNSSLGLILISKIYRLNLLHRKYILNYMRIRRQSSPVQALNINKITHYKDLSNEEKIEFHFTKIFTGMIEEPENIVPSNTKESLKLAIIYSELEIIEKSNILIPENPSNFIDALWIYMLHKRNKNQEYPEIISKYKFNKISSQKDFFSLLSTNTPFKFSKNELEINYLFFRLINPQESMNTFLKDHKFNDDQ